MSLNHDGCHLRSIVQFFFIEKLTDHFWKVRSNPKSFTIGETGKIVFTMEFLTAASALVPLAPLYLSICCQLMLESSFSL